MNHLDIIIIALVALGAYRGYKNGLVMEIATLAGLVLGIYLAIIASGVVGLVARGMVDWNPVPFQIIAFMLTFALVIFLLKFVAILVEKVFKVLFVNFINKIAGIILGSVKFAIIAGVVLHLISATGINLLPEKIRTDSCTYSKVTGLVYLFFPHKGFFDFGEHNEKKKSEE